MALGSAAGGEEARPAAGSVLFVLFVRFHAPAGGPLGEDTYTGLLALLAELTPVVQALPPDAALADVRGALRYFGRDAAELASIVRVRALARHGVDCTVGVAANPLLARMAAAEHSAGQYPGAGRTGAGHPGAGRTEAERIGAGRGGSGYAARGGASGGGWRSGARDGRQGGAPDGSRYGWRGAVRTVPDDPKAVAAFLARKPAAALDGVGPVTARTLDAYGLGEVGRIAAAPPGTLQRILGATAGRAVYERAHGIDRVPVTPNSLARSIGSEHRFAGDELDPAQRRRALLALADELGSRLRTSGQVARAVTLTVRYADRSVTTRSRTLPEPTAHTPALTSVAYALHEALALERARVRAVALRAEDLTAAELSSRQLTFDPADDKARRIEAVTDRARAKFGAHAARPAGAAGVA
ncbi:DNA polymerase-4 [Streptomyces zagrosensis]|uniref:DNA polymerase-4 n=1 Tax=Streptomyces zagrosensis TaxID=1042984 RepID=A0A7W9QC36_9ACTN|nr:DNA polymerase-4 [Streptomyces zagrosensis]